MATTAASTAHSGSLLVHRKGARRQGAEREDLPISRLAQVPVACLAPSPTAYVMPHHVKQLHSSAPLDAMAGRQGPSSSDFTSAPGSKQSGQTAYGRFPDGIDSPRHPAGQAGDGAGYQRAGRHRFQTAPDSMGLERDG